MAQQLVEFTRYVLPLTEDGRRDVALLRVELPGTAHLVWEELTGEVYAMHTRPDVRRQGHMRQLWAAANRIRPVAHSPWRTDDGDAFARAVGGPLPPRLRA